MEEEYAMRENKPIRIGWASCSITPDRPIFLAGQMYYRVSRYVHDPITSTALVLDNGDTHTILISNDMVGTTEALTARIRAQLDGFDGIDGSHVSVSATHTHNSCRYTPGMLRNEFEPLFGADKCQLMEVPDDILEGEEAVEFYLSRVIPMVKDAWHNRKPGGIAYAEDYAAVAFNRRPVFGLGGGGEESRMYGACSEKNFLRFEGPSDHTIDMLYTFDADRNLTGVLVDVPCPSQVFELHYFITADYWNYARNSLRERMGDHLYVLPLCGAAGDQNPLDLIRLSKTNVQALKEWNAQVGEVFRNFDMAEEAADIGGRITDSVARGFKKARNRIQTRPAFLHEHFDMELPIRLVSEEDYSESKRAIQEFGKKFSAEHRMESADQVAMFNDIGVVERWELQQKTRVYRFSVNLTRIGDVAIITNPFELFSEYGMRIRAKCKAAQVFNAQLSNGSGDYLPTVAAVRGGSYSAKPASTKIGPEGGDRLAEVYIERIDKLFSGSC